MIVLRDYQQRMVSVTHEALRRVRKVCLVAPCGAGKRYLAVAWCMRIAELGRKVLVVTNRRLLVEQMADECKLHGLTYGIVMGNEPRNDSALVQIASLATLKRRKWNDMPEAAWVICDECHLDGAAYKQLFDIHATAKVVGLTATPVGRWVVASWTF